VVPPGGAQGPCGASADVDPRAADEVFITSSTKDVLPVHAIDDRPVVAPGPVTARATEIFARLSADRLDPEQEE